jgi:FimV-like protein
VAFEADLTHDPDRLSALNDLAVSYVLDGHGDAARRLLDEVVASGDPAEQQAALVNLGELYAAEGYLAAAQAYLETARSLDPSRPEPLYALALLADARGDLAAARATLREALRRDEGGAARAAFAYVYPEERVHLEALVAEQVGDRVAQERWRDLAGGRFAPLTAAAERHLAGE